MLCFSQTLRYKRHLKPQDSSDQTWSPYRTKVIQYVGGLIPEDKTIVSQNHIQINAKITHTQKKKYAAWYKNVRQWFTYIIHVYWHHSFIITMSPHPSIHNQTSITITIQISTMINNSSKFKFSCTKYLILHFSNHLNGRWNKEWCRVLSSSTIRYKETVKLYY